MQSENRKPAWRRFVTLQVALGFLVLTVTGLVMFFWPPRAGGAAAHFSLLGLGRHGWEDLHITFSFLFLAAVSLHLWLNRRALFGYFGRRAPRLRISVEALVSALLGLLLVGGTLLLA